MSERHTNRSRFIPFLLLGCLFIATGCRPQTVEGVLSSLESRQKMLKTLQADITTIIQPYGDEGPEIRQTGKIFTETPNKSRVEITSPFNQVTITNGNKMQIEDPHGKRSRPEDLSKMSDKPVMPQGGGATQLAEALGQFDLRIREQAGKVIEIEGTPKKTNANLTKIVVIISKEILLPIQITLWGPAEMMSDTHIEYQRISGIYVPVKNRAEVALAHGKMTVDIQFENIIVNQPLPEEIFQIRE